jgi:hypothetical protein
MFFPAPEVGVTAPVVDGATPVTEVFDEDVETRETARAAVGAGWTPRTGPESTTPAAGTDSGLTDFPNWEDNTDEKPDFDSAAPDASGIRTFC